MWGMKGIGIEVGEVMVRRGIDERKGMGRKREGWEKRKKRRKRKVRREIEKVSGEGELEEEE